MVTKSNSRLFKRPKFLAASVLSVAALMALAAAGKQSVGLSALDANLAYGGKFYTEFTNQIDAFNAAHELSGQIVSEGACLFKNDGTLPIDPRTNAVTVLGVRSGDIAEAVDGTIVAPQSVDPMAAGLRNAGFKVNPVMQDFYAGLSTREEKKEVTEFPDQVMRSLNSYDDVAVIVIQRIVGKENISPEVALTGKKSADNKVDGVETLAGHRDQDGALREFQDKKEGADEKAAYGWDHKHPAWSPVEQGDDVTDANVHTVDGKDYVEVKHGLQLTDTEQELIEFAKSHFKKVVFTLNSSHTFEFYNLEKDPGINGIIWFGRPGQHSAGITAVGKIISGEVNPSGGASYEYERDFTADPTYMNNSTGRQFRYGALADNVPGDYVGRYPNDLEHPENAYLTGVPGTQLSGVRYMDYEEDIYFGYRYYETFYNEIREGHTSLTQPGDNEATRQQIADEWHDYNVVYPFGFGLSYTEWQFDFKGMFSDAAAKTAISSPTQVVNAEGVAQYIYAKVNVKNIGDMEGKKTVQIYVTAPYTAGGVEKSFVKLVGFAKTGYLKPGQSQDVIVKIDVLDVASFDYDDKNNNSKTGYELDLGNYVFKAMGNSSELRSKRLGEYDDFTLPLAAAITEIKDTFTGADIVPLFSDPNERDYTLRKDDGSWSKKVGVGSVLLSRADMEGTFPFAPTYDDLIMSEEAIAKDLLYYDMGTENNMNGAFGDEYGALDKDAPWNQEGKIPEGWTQAADNKATPTYMLKDMSGLPFSGNEVITEGVFKDKTVDEAWELFMNQLTYDEMKSQFTSSPAAIDRIGKLKDVNGDRPLNLRGTFTWPDAPLQAATFNVELIERAGELLGEMSVLKGTTGWWGPGANVNRGHFDGRCKEYYSQDGVHNGYIAAAASRGAQSRGINVYIKHYAIHNEEDTGCSLYYFLSEQDFRECYLSSFRKVFEEGHCMAAMPNAQKEGNIQGPNNYDFLTTLTRGEWDFQGEYVSDHFGGQKSPSFLDPRAKVAAESLEGDAKEAFLKKYTWTAKVNGSESKKISNNNLDLCLRNNVCPMSNPNYRLNGVWNADLRDHKGSVQSWWGEMDGEEKKFVECDTEYYYMRITAQRAMYKSANSVLVRNGVDISAFNNKTVDAEGKQGTAMNVASPATEAALNGEAAKFAITAGQLPEGLTLNAKTGAISGTPSVSGSFSVTVGVTVDNWITASYKVNLAIESAWTLSLDGLKAGEEVTDGSIVCGIAGIPANATYAVASGQLPDGLEVAADGTITGTPTAAGEFKFQIKVSYSSGSGRNARTVTYTSEEFVINVEGDGNAPVVHGGIVSSVINDQGHLVITYEDGAVVDLGLVVGANGQNGAAGATGATGPQGPQGPQGPAGADGKDGKDGAAAEASSGCNGSIVATSGIMALVAGLGLAVVALKKKRD